MGPEYRDTRALIWCEVILICYVDFRGLYQGCQEAAWSQYNSIENEFYWYPIFICVAENCQSITEYLYSSFTVQVQVSL